MSTEEQDMAIGRLVRERTEANRQLALLRDEIGKWSTKASNLYGYLSTIVKDEPTKTMRCLEIIDGLISAGGLDRLKALLSEQQTLSQRVAEVGVTLRNSGAE